MGGIPVNEKTALVTGANRGIGYAVAKKLFCNGYRVCASYLHTFDIAQFLEETNGVDEQDRIRACQADVTDIEQIDHLFTVWSRPLVRFSCWSITQESPCSLPFWKLLLSSGNLLFLLTGKAPTSVPSRQQKTCCGMAGKVPLSISHPIKPPAAGRMPACMVLQNVL